MISNDLLVHLYRTQGEVHIQLQGRGGVFEYFYLVLYKLIDVHGGYS